MNDNVKGAAPPPPFACTFSQTLPELLHQLNISLAVSTYQAGKLVFISAADKDQLIQLPRNFQRPMGLAVSGHKLAVATQHETMILANAPGLAALYPQQKGVYDGFYVPRATYYTGPVDMHEMAWGGDTLWAVNTAFSCLCTIDADFSFKPRWQPDFISELVPEDRCHLNGLVLKDDKPKYVTALAQSDTKEGWRAEKNSGGILMDVENKKILLTDLPMPHSPHFYDGRLLLLLSATGELVEVDLDQKTYTVLKQLDGFVRGMDQHGDYLFVGLSKLRKTSTAFGDMPIAKRSPVCGVVVIHMPSMSIVGHIHYAASVEEVFDVKVLPGQRRPGLLGTQRPDHKLALSLPEGSFWAVPEAKG
jgi:uncharacterized protein (TIGR03032 family)